MRLKNILTLVLLFLAVSILSSCQSSTEKNSNISTASGDWPSYSFEELVSKSDIVVYGEIINTENVNSSPPSQESNLNILKLLKGDGLNKSIKIKLSDPEYYVNTGSKYVMFLDDTGSYYTQESFNSLLEELNGKISSNISGLNGDYTIDEILSEINKLSSN